jgi:FkbM family methyltransferase
MDENTHNLNVGRDPLSSYIKRVLKRGNVVVDVGANSGTISIPASRLIGHTGKVLAFEPAKIAYTRLLKNIKLNRANNITAFKKGLGNKNQKLSLEIGLFGDGLNSLVPHKYDLRSTEKVEVVTGDSIIHGPVDFVKIDVEGYEPEVIHGMKRILTTYHPIVVFEFNFDHIWQKDKKFNASFELLKQYGYNNFVDLNTGKEAFSYKDLSRTLVDISATVKV